MKSAFFCVVLGILFSKWKKKFNWQCSEMCRWIFFSSTIFWTPRYKVVNTTITNASNLIAAFSRTSTLNLQVGYVGIVEGLGKVRKFDDAIFVRFKCKNENVVLTTITKFWMPGWELTNCLSLIVRRKFQKYADHTSYEG